MKKHLSPVLMLAIAFGSVVTGISTNSYAQVADPVVSGNRPFTLALAKTVYANNNGNSAGTVSFYQAQNPSGLSGGTTNDPGGSAPGANILFNGASPSGLTGGQTVLNVIGDIQLAADVDFNSSLIDGDNVPGVFRLFQYNTGSGNTGPIKSRTTITIGNGQKSISLNGAPGTNSGGVAYPDTYLGATSDAQSGRRYYFNANNLIINKEEGNGVPNRYIFVRRMTIEVAGTLSLISGRVIMGSTDTFVVSPLGTSGTGSINAYVDGMFKNRNIASVNTVFPVGDQSVYAPVTFSSLGLAPTTIQYFADGTTPNTSSKAAGIDMISSFENYVINSAAPAGTVITLPYNPASRSGYMTDASKVILTGYNGSQWIQLGTPVALAGNLSTTLSQSLSGISRLALGTIFSNPLPVQFTAFDVRKDEDHFRSLLTWSVGNNAFGTSSYSVERSNDGRSFTSIAIVKVLGTEHGKFSAVDAEPLMGINYYRIRATAQSGKDEISAIRKLSYDMDGSISLAPNPATDATYITFSGATDYGLSTIRVMNAAGQIVIYQQALANPGSRIMLETNTLVPGVYMMQVSNAQNANVFISRFTKQ